MYFTYFTFEIGGNVLDYLALSEHIQGTALGVCDGIS